MFVLFNSIEICSISMVSSKKINKMYSKLIRVLPKESAPKSININDLVVSFVFFSDELIISGVIFFLLSLVFVTDLRWPKKELSKKQLFISLNMRKTSVIFKVVNQVLLLVHQFISPV